eukprot:m.480005 g.480005  ORF g.480005 m.480005 type:complete len:440 (-) comp21666_c0_seq1:206-1525(-)
MFSSVGRVATRGMRMPFARQPVRNLTNAQGDTLAEFKAINAGAPKGDMQVTICGGGNAAHVCAGLLGARSHFNVNIYTPLANEVKSFNEYATADGVTVSVAGRGDVTGQVTHASQSPADVIPGSKLIILTLPAFAHESVLADIAPFVSPGAVIGALPARSFFDLACADKLGDKLKESIIFGLQTLPWACRINEFGKSATVLGTKADVDICTTPNPNNEVVEPVAEVLGDVFGLKLSGIDNFTAITLANTGQLIHPGIMYGRWASWDGAVLGEKPLFYQGVDEFTQEVLTDMSSEVLAITDALVEATNGKFDMSAVASLYDWLTRSYAGQIADESSLKSAFNTNAAYQGLTHPMIEAEGGYLPDFQARYLTEDVPYGIVGTCGIGKLLGVDTPTIDKVVVWAQTQIGREYLVDGKMTGADVASTRVPQRYGMTKVEEIFV